MNIKLLISYEGTDFFGWQKTKTGPSIQEELETALERLLQEKISVEAASRTDRGVHAKGQVAHFLLKKDVDLFKLKKGINALLPKTIVVHEMEREKEDFHPTLDACFKEYHYEICYGEAQSPFYRNFSWHTPPLHIELMQEAAESLIGFHPFDAFANEGQQGERTLYEVKISLLGENRLRIGLKGDRFLYKMARTLVGTLVDVGCGKIKPESLHSILKSRDRKKAGITAPAHGLTLFHVSYTEIEIYPLLR